MQNTTKVAANPDVISRQILNGEMILVNTETSTSLALQNPTAVAIWELVDGKRTVQEIVAAIEQQFEDAPSTVTRDVISVLDTLAEAGFVIQEAARPISPPK